MSDTAPTLNLEAHRAQLLSLQDAALGLLRGVQAALLALPPAPDAVTQEESRQPRTRRRPVPADLPQDLNDP